MKRMISFMLVLMLCLGMTTTIYATENELPTTNISWNENAVSGWAVTLDEVKGSADASLMYQIDLFCNGEICMRYDKVYQQDAANVTVDVSNDVRNPGDYTARVTAYTVDAGGNTVYGASSVTEAKTYTKPASALGTTVGVWSDEKDKVLMVPSVEGAWVYEFTLIFIDEENNTGYLTDADISIYGNESDRAFRDTAGKTYEIDFSSKMQRVGVYYVVTRALSADMNVIAHGEYGEPSELYHVEPKPETNDKPIEGYPVPNIDWAADGSWDISIDRIEGSTVDRLYYEASVWEGDTCVASANFGGYNSPSVNDRYSSSMLINKSGTYKIKVRSYRVINNQPVYGEYAETSERVYVRPEAALETVTGHWDADRTGVFVFKGVENAQSYMCTLYILEKNGPFMFGRRQMYYTEANEQGIFEVDFTGMLTREGEYVVTIKPLSQHIDKIANGVEGPQSDVLDTRKEAVDVENVAGNANSFADAKDGLAYLVTNASKEDIKVAMQTDAGALAEIKKLEERYAAQQNISVKPAAVTEDAAKYVDADKVSVIGAALNAQAGEEVKLNIAIPEVPEKLDENYRSAVQIDIKLLSGGRYLENLNVPVTITMPIPTGVSINNLCIYHYHAGNRSGERVLFSVDSANHTITFTVTGFSTFVFANVEESGSGSGTGSAVADNGGSQQIDFAGADGTAMRWISSEQNNNISVSGTQNNIPSGAVFNARRIYSGDEILRVANAVISTKGDVEYVAYDFTLATADGQPILSFNGHVDVSMPVPSTFTIEEGEVLSVYYLTDAGKLQRCNSVVSDNFVTFGTTHLSTFVYVVETTASAAASPVVNNATATNVTGVTSPKTGEVDMTLYVTMLAIAALGVTVYGTRKVKYYR